MNKVLSAAKVSVEGYWPGLFVKALKGQDIDKLLANVGSAPAAGAAGAAAGAGAAAAEPEKEEEKKEEEEADVDMGDLFGGDY